MPQSVHHQKIVMSEIPPEENSINHQGIMIPQEEKSMDHQEIIMPEIPSEEKSMNQKEFMQKKKKKKKPSSASASSSYDAEPESSSDCKPKNPTDGEPKKEESNSKGYYDYEELLDRVFNMLRESNSELAGGRHKMVLRPPEVLREGTKKTVLVNFIALCKGMHREPEHVMNFFLVEMGTSGSLDGCQRLVVKGRFAPKNFESILQKYVNEYVKCCGCKSFDTILSKENRLLFVRCEQCGSARSVAPIKAGFVARVSRRNAET